MHVFRSLRLKGGIHACTVYAERHHTEKRRGSEGLVALLSCDTPSVRAGLLLHVVSYVRLSLSRIGTAWWLFQRLP
jgi:hypothetical protein